tara:strand:- start:7462 stop:8163 length:702 start_codon:yes stop_codon:yes gene_type:complete
MSKLDNYLSDWRAIEDNLPCVWSGLQLSTKNQIKFFKDSTNGKTYSFKYNLDEQTFHFDLASLFKRKVFTLKSKIEQEKIQQLLLDCFDRSVEKLLNHNFINEDKSPQPNEEKNLEWFKTSLVPLISAVKSTDSKEDNFDESHLLNLELWSGKREKESDFYILRIIVFNLDILMNYNSEGLELIIYDKKNKANFDYQTDPSLQATFQKYPYNVVKELVSLLNSLKSALIAQSF